MSSEHDVRRGSLEVSAVAVETEQDRVGDRGTEVEGQVKEV